jgi:choline dehydrogenase-like flavoprotein
MLDGDTAAGVIGYFHVPILKKNIAPFSLRARKAVIVAASEIQTPGLLRRSGIRSRHLGAHFQAHPAVGLVGVFDQTVNMWFGATQGYEVDEHRADGCFKVETVALPPELILARLPGVGRKWLMNMAEASHMASWGVEIRAEAQGSIREGLFGTDIKYDLTARDMAHLRQGLRFTAELFFAAGAREVITGIHGLPERLHSVADAKLLERGPDDPAAYSFLTSHLFGTARMSVAEKDGVVGTDLHVHGTKNFYVIDSSVFPTNLGVNPQHTIMGIAMHAAHRIAGRNFRAT